MQTRKKVQTLFSSNFEAGDVCDVRLHKSKLKFPAFGNLAVLSIQINRLFLTLKCVALK